MHPLLLIFLLLAAATLTLVFTLLILLLSFPFVCRFELAGGRGVEFVQRIEVRWLFLSRVIDGFASAGREDRREDVVVEADVGDAAGGVAGSAAGRRSGAAWDETDIRRLFELFRTLHRPVTALVRKVVQRIEFKELSCRATFGLDDPAETGMLSGFLYAASAPLTRLPAVSIRLHPVFHEQTFAYRIICSLKVTMWRVVIPTIVFLCDSAVRGVIVRRVRGSFAASSSASNGTI